MYLDQEQLHQTIMAMIWAKADPEKIQFLEEAERARMGVKNFVAHQYGVEWKQAQIHKTYSEAMTDIPTGAL